MRARGRRSWAETARHLLAVGVLLALPGCAVGTDPGNCRNIFATATLVNTADPQEVVRLTTDRSDFAHQTPLRICNPTGAAEEMADGWWRAYLGIRIQEICDSAPTSALGRQLCSDRRFCTADVAFERRPGGNGVLESWSTDGTQYVAGRASIGARPIEACPPPDPSRDPSLPRIRITPDPMDFRSPVGTPVPQTLTVGNIGLSPLRLRAPEVDLGARHFEIVAGATATNPCRTRVGTDTVEVPLGRECTVVVRFAAEEAGTFTGSLRFDSNDPARVTRVPLTATGVPGLLEASPRSVCLATGEARTVTFTNMGEGRLTITGIRSTPLPEVDSPLPFTAATTRRGGGSVAVGDTIAAREPIETVISATGAGEGRLTVNVRGAAPGGSTVVVRVLVGSGPCP